jgi:hypothetical protein
VLIHGVWGGGLTQVVCVRVKLRGGGLSQMVSGRVEG